MAALIVESARSTRADARLLRSRAMELRLDARSGVELSRQRLRKAHLEAARALEHRDARLPSPWSGLLWTRDGEALDRTLVPLV